MEEELNHMIEEHTTEVEDCFERSDCGGNIMEDVYKAIRQGNTHQIDWNRVIRDQVEIAAEYALEEHDGDFIHKPDKERGDR